MLRALSSFYEFTVQSTFDSFELKRTSVVYGIGVSIALVYVPTAFIYKMEGLSQRTSMLSRSTLTLIAPGLPHVIDALDHPPPAHPILAWLNVCIQGGLSSLGGLIYVAIWQSFLFVGNNAFGRRGWIGFSLMLFLVQVYVADISAIIDLVNEDMVRGTQRSAIEIAMAWSYYVSNIVMTLSIALLCSMPLAFGRDMAMLNPYIFFRRQPLEHLEKLDADAQREEERKGRAGQKTKPKSGSSMRELVGGKVDDTVDAVKETVDAKFNRLFVDNMLRMPFLTRGGAVVGHGRSDGPPAHILRLHYACLVR